MHTTEIEMLSCTVKLKEFGGQRPELHRIWQLNPRLSSQCRVQLPNHVCLHHYDIFFSYNCLLLPMSSPHQVNSTPWKCWIWRRKMTSSACCSLPWLSLSCMLTQVFPLFALHTMKSWIYRRRSHRMLTAQRFLTAPLKWMVEIDWNGLFSQDTMVVKLGQSKNVIVLYFCTWPNQYPLVLLQLAHGSFHKYMHQMIQGFILY